MDEEIEMDEHTIEVEQPKPKILNPKKILAGKEIKKPQNLSPSFWQAS